jgi:hypothetical protein
VDYFIAPGGETRKKLIEKISILENKFITEPSLE